MIEIKDPNVLDGMLKRRYHVTLRRLIRWILSQFRNVTFTESYRPKQHPNDLHGTNPVRAVDVRSWVYPAPQKIADRINAAWEYDYKRPEKQACKYHGKGKNKHFHLQVHDNTRMREWNQHLLKHKEADGGLKWNVQTHLDLGDLMD